MQVCLREVYSSPNFCIGDVLDKIRAVQKDFGQYGRAYAATLLETPLRDGQDLMDAIAVGLNSPRNAPFVDPHVKLLLTYGEITAAHDEVCEGLQQLIKVHNPDSDPDPIDL